MQRTQSIAKFIAAGVLSVAIAPLSVLVAKADDESRLAWLFEAQCVSESPGRWRQEIEDVSVGREVYRSVMFMGPGSQFASLACRIRGGEDTETSDKNVQSLNLEFGMRDRHRESPYNNVIVYLDGEESAATTVAPGERVVLSLDVSNISNIAIETVCSTKVQYCDRVYFFDASLSADVAVTTEETTNQEPTKFDNLPPSEVPTEVQPTESELVPSESNITQPETLPSIN